MSLLFLKEHVYSFDLYLGLPKEGMIPLLQPFTRGANQIKVP